jgi:hypothetical protein
MAHYPADLRIMEPPELVAPQATMVKLDRALGDVDKGPFVHEGKRIVKRT